MKKKRVTEYKTKLTTKQSKILSVKNEHPSLTVREIAALAGTSHPHVVQTLRQFGVSQKNLQNYKGNRADVFAAVQYRLLHGLTNEGIKKTPIGSRILAACQLYTNERLERGQSTSNQSVQMSLSEGLQDSVNKLIHRVSVDKSVDNPIHQPFSELSTMQAIDITHS